MVQTLPDEQLVAPAKSGDEIALATLLQRYLPVVLQKAAGFRAIGLERDDYLQEGLLGFFKAVLTYQEEKARFSTYAGTCIENSLRSAYKTTARQKNIPLNTYLSLSGGERDVALTGSNPEDEIIGREQLLQVRESVKKLLSPLEYNVFALYLNGCSYGEIAVRQSITEKSVDNAIQRIRKKLRAIFK